MTDHSRQMRTTPALPASWYCEGEAFQQEKRTLFATSWQLLASTSALREPGDFVTANLGGWPVFALVDEEGGIGAFRNVCRHQGMQVLEKPRGRCTTLRCRYHGWTYDFAGRMVSAPDLVAPSNPRSPDNHLCRINSEVLGPLLYVNLDARAARLDVALGGLALFLAERLGDTCGELTIDVACNWKTYVEHCLTTRTFGVPGDAGACLWQWPLVMIEPAPASLSVQQIIPRTFSRTRVVEYVCVANDAHASDALDAARSRAQADKSACEALQRRREAGETGDEPAFASFHRAIHDVHAQTPRLDSLPLAHGVA